jgi:hypothetical protein
VNSYADSQPSVSIAVRTARIAEEKGLVGYWPLDDGQGDVARDPIDTLAKGAVEGEYTWIRANGIGETALELHGSGNAPSQVVVSDNAKMRFSGLQSFTWSIDVDPTTPIRRAESILSKARLSSAWIDLGIDSGGKWSLAGPLGALLGSVATEGRHMLIAVQDAKTGTRYLYVDGNLAATGPSQAADGAGDLWIGGSEQGGDGFKGRVSLVRVYARALSASDVSALSHAP